MLSMKRKENINYIKTDVFTWFLKNLNKKLEAL